MSSELIERRDKIDRRRPAKWYSSLPKVGGRRSHARRARDCKNYYVDRYKPSYLYIVLATFVLSCLDAAFTLQLLSMGAAKEINPVMRILIDSNVQLFLLIKFALTASGLIYLAVHMNFHFFKLVKVKHLIYGFFAIYLMLIKYELILLMI